MYVCFSPNRIFIYERNNFSYLLAYTLLHLYASKPKLSVVSYGSKYKREIVDGQCDIVFPAIIKYPRAYEFWKYSSLNNTKRVLK